MADFCQQCSEELFGADGKDLAELCDTGSMAEVLCEGCGLITVDHQGRRVSYVEDWI